MFILDMTIHFGNSGGALVNEEDGTVVGIVDSVLTLEEKFPVGLGFAVPINLVKPFVDTTLRFTSRDWKRLKRKAETQAERSNG